MNVLVEQRWWQAQDLSSLTEVELRMVTMRYGLGEDGKAHTFKEIGIAIGISIGHVWRLLDQIRVRVDRATLLQAGVAMQLKVDARLRGQLPLSADGVSLTVGKMFDRLESIGLVGYNSLLDKSSRWMLEAGIGRGTVLRVEKALSAQDMFLRGKVPDDPRRRTSLPHILTSL